MSAFDFIKGLVGGHKKPVDQLALLGADESRTQEFLELLSRSKIWVLGEASASRTEATVELNEAQVLQELKEHMDAAAKIKSTDNVRICTLKIKDYAVVPFFTSQDFLSKNVESTRIDKVTYFSGFESDPAILLRDDVLRLPAIMNPNASLTPVFGADDKIGLAKLLSSRQH